VLNSHISICYLFVRNAEASLVEIESRDRHYKRILHMVNICQSYRQESSAMFFLTHGVLYCIF